MEWGRHIDPLSNCTKVQFVLMITKAVVYMMILLATYSDIKETDYIIKA